MLTLLVALTGFAQGAERIELPAQDARDVDVLPAGEQGVLLFTQGKGDGEKTYTVSAFDTELEQRWSTQITLEQKHVELDRDADTLHAFLLLARGKWGRVLKTNLEDGSIEVLDVVPSRKTAAREVVADGAGGAWVAGLSRKGSALTWISPEGESHGIDIEPKRWVTGMGNIGVGRAYAGLRDSRGRPGAPLTMLELQQGQVVDEVQVTPDPGLVLLTGRLVTVDAGTFAVGTWGEPGLLYNRTDGIYLARIEDGTQKDFRSTRFTDLDNALEFLPERAQRRLERKEDAKQAKGKALRLKWNLLMHDPIETQDGWVVVAEAFVPITHTETRTITVSDGKGGTTTQTQTYTVFDGWQTTHALVLGFDDDGKRLWDHSVRVVSPLSPWPVERVRAVPVAGGVNLIYPVRKQKLARAEIRGSELVLGENLTVDDANAGDDVKKNLVADAVWWYDDRFLLFGFDKMERGEENRRRFFLTTLE